MELSKLKQLIDLHTPLGHFTSLPFVVGNDNGLEIRWFTYELSGNSNLTVKKIFTLHRNGTIVIMLPREMTFELSLDEEFKDFDEYEYYDQFQLAYNAHDNCELRRMLNQAETESSLAIYDVVAKYQEI